MQTMRLKQQIYTKIESNVIKKDYIGLQIYKYIYLYKWLMNAHKFILNSKKYLQ